MEDELDRMLSTRDEIVPSSGFVLAVMDAVRREAAEAEPTPLPPIAFPWVRALPVFVALAAVVVMLIAGLIEVARMPVAAVRGPLLPPVVEQALAQANAGWIAIALLIAFFSAFLPIRLAARR
jgi:hypothetical protein